MPDILNKNFTISIIVENLGVLSNRCSYKEYSFFYKRRSSPSSQSFLPCSDELCHEMVRDTRVMARDNLAWNGKSLGCHGPRRDTLQPWMSRSIVDAPFAYLLPSSCVTKWFVTPEEREHYLVLNDQSGPRRVSRAVTSSIRQKYFVPGSSRPGENEFSFVVPLNSGISLFPK